MLSNKILDFIRQVFRTREWVISKILFNTSIVFAFFIIVGENPTDKFAIYISVIVYILSVGALGYFINDVFDAKPDNISGKPNKSASLSISTKIAIFVILILSAGIPFWFLLPKIEYYLGFTSVQIFLFIVYSIPGLRLKKTFLGILCDAAYSYVLPAIIVLSICIISLNININPTYKSVVFIVWLSFIGIRSIINHQISDLKNDIKSGEKTFVYKLKRNQSVFLLKTITSIELISFFILVLSTPSYHLVMGISLGILLTLEIFEILVFNNSPFNKTKFFFEALNRYYDYYIFMSFLILFAININPFFAIIPGAYVLVRLRFFRWFYYKPILWLYYKIKGGISLLKNNH
jgi:hypothetical protein